MNLGEELKGLEQQLLTSAVRKDEAKVASLLVAEFREFGSSGRMFDKTAILAELRDEIPAVLRMHEFRAEPLAEGVVLVTYRAVREEMGEASRETLRSSVWVCRDERWQMLFHQGTRVA